MKFFFISVLWSLIMSINAYASNLTGEIDGYASYEMSGTKYFYFTIKNYTRTAGECNTHSKFVFNDTKNIYEVLSATIISAYHSKSPVNVNYTKACTVASYSYNANYICVGNLSPC